MVGKLVGLGNDVTELLRRTSAETKSTEPCPYQLPVETITNYEEFCTWLNDPVNHQRLVIILLKT